MGCLGMDRGVPVDIPRGHVAGLDAEILAPSTVACRGSPSPETVDTAPDRASPAPGVIPPVSSRGTPWAGKPVGDHLGLSGHLWRAHLRRGDCLENKGWEGRQPWSVSHEMEPAALTPTQTQTSLLYRVPDESRGTSWWSRG